MYFIKYTGSMFMEGMPYHTYTHFYLFDLRYAKYRAECINKLWLMGKD